VSKPPPAFWQDPQGDGEDVAPPAELDAPPVADGHADEEDDDASVAPPADR
jgi:hypothetical protein